MKICIWPILALLLLSACQSQPKAVTILDGGQVISLSTTKTVPADILAEAKITLGPNDRLLYLGSSTALESAISVNASITLTVRRAVTLTVVETDGEQSFQTSAQTVGQALTEAGYTLFATDRLEPPAETPISDPLTVRYQPGREIVFTVDGSQVRVLSAAATVGQALAEAGIPLIGLDTSIPEESALLPDDGRIRVVRVVESVALTQKSIPFNTRTELSPDLEIDQQTLQQGGEPGLAIVRLRIRSEDGVQVSQQSENESFVRRPQDRVLGIGTKIVIRTTTVDGVTIEYWRALTLYATYYQPCDSGPTKCQYGTASGTTVRKGAVAFVYPWYLLLAGEQLYIPGYGYGFVEDNNGASISAYGNTHWIDLGYSQTDVVDWDSRYVTVYFLTPIAANVADMYILP